MLYLISWVFIFLIIVLPNVFILLPPELLALVLKRETAKDSLEFLQCKKEANKYISLLLLILSFIFCRSIVGYFVHVVLNPIIR